MIATFKAMKSKKLQHYTQHLGQELKQPNVLHVQKERRKD